MDSAKFKKTLLHLLPVTLFAFIGNIVSFSVRNATGRDISDKFMSFIEILSNKITIPLPSLHWIDLLVGLASGAVFYVYWKLRKANAKQFRTGKEHGSARWSTEEESKILRAKHFCDNLIVTATLWMTMKKPKSVKIGRNHNILIIGTPGTGKTRFYIKPNLMQMFGSYVVTDPKGTVLIECGKMLERGRPKRDAKGKVLTDKAGKIIYEPYNIKVFNTVDFGKSMHYNPMAYIRPDHREVDILKLVDALIRNTSGSGKQATEDFWVKAERLLYTSYIALIFAIYPEEERNFASLIELINDSEVRENDEDFKNHVDLLFDAIERWLENRMLDEAESAELEAEDTESSLYFLGLMTDLDGETPTNEQASIARFAIRQYKAYKLAAGKTAKSILISCATRLGVFSIDEILEITSYDELELGKLGDELSALFVIVPDSDATFNFLVAILYTQMFNLLCTRADSNRGGKLKYHVHCLLDEFKNTGEIPGFDKLISTIRSREISASIVLQSKSQLKDLYKDNAATIEDCCDSMLFLGGSDKTTLKEISESLGKETIDIISTSTQKGQSESSGVSYQKQGRELMTSEEIFTMDRGKCIARVGGFHPFFCDKYDITKHPMYGCLLDSHMGKPDEATFTFDIAAYTHSIRKQQKATVSGDTVVEVYDTKSGSKKERKSQ